MEYDIIWYNHETSGISSHLGQEATTNHSIDIDISWYSISPFSDCWFWAKWKTAPPFSGAPQTTPISVNGFWILYTVWQAASAAQKDGSRAAHLHGAEYVTCWQLNIACRNVLILSYYQNHNPKIPQTYRKVSFVARYHSYHSYHLFLYSRNWLSISRGLGA